MKPFLIGLTGNIASGKSAIRQYLENAGALTLDADLIAQDTYLPGQPAWQPILDRFGEELRGLDGQINRGRLGRIVFNDPQALKDLENIVHPFVWQRLDELLAQTATPIVVVEAIKLVNTPFAGLCDEIWVATASPQVRVQRLIEKRGLSELDAHTRVESQEPESEKTRQAHRLVSTDGTFHQVYRQVADHLLSIESEKGISLAHDSDWQPVTPDQFNSIREIIGASLSNIEADEDIYRLLSRSNWISNGKVVVLYDILHFLTLLHMVIPYKTTVNTKREIVDELLRISAVHLSDALIVKLLWLSPREAKALAFEPGDYASSGAQGFIYRDVLRRQGLMPGEVYRKPV